MKLLLGVAVLALSSLVFSLPAQAADVALTIKDHKFIPETLDVPANEKIKITITNEDATPEEFESHELNREKVISGNSKGVVFVGPLDPGTYPFFGEFHAETAKGQIVSK
jgi:plastocyanin